MCLAVIALGCHPEFDLVLAANRDEFYKRPAAQASFWPGVPEVLAGRDLEKGGTWLGVTRHGRFALLTNFRDPKSLVRSGPSRGLLVSGYLTSTETPEAYLDRITKSSSEFTAFNLVLGSRNRLVWFSNRTMGRKELGTGIHGLSNALLDTPWPKTVRTKERVAAALTSGTLNAEQLFEALRNEERPQDGDLPETGVGLEWERVLSSPFIRSKEYGTRNSTVVLFSRDGLCRFEERTFDPESSRVTSVVEEFRLLRSGGSEA